MIAKHDHDAVHVQSGKLDLAVMFFAEMLSYEHIVKKIDWEDGRAVFVGSAQNPIPFQLTELDGVTAKSPYPAVHFAFRVQNVQEACKEIEEWAKKHLVGVEVEMDGPNAFVAILEIFAVRIEFKPL
ncbi:MAG: hypothetical protein AAB443_03825 [Patescibacteria group bacterium]